MAASSRRLRRSTPNPPPSSDLSGGIHHVLPPPHLSPRPTDLLPDRKVLAHFHFRSASDSNGKHHHVFSKAARRHIASHPPDLLRWVTVHDGFIHLNLKLSHILHPTTLIPVGSQLLALPNNFPLRLRFADDAVDRDERPESALAGLVRRVPGLCGHHWSGGRRP